MRPLPSEGQTAFGARFSLPINHLNAFTSNFCDPAARARLRPDWLQLYDLVLHSAPFYAQHRLHAPELPLDFAPRTCRECGLPPAMPGGTTKGGLPVPRTRPGGGLPPLCGGRYQRRSTPAEQEAPPPRSGRYNSWSLPLSVASHYRSAIPSLPDHIEAPLSTPSREPSLDLFLRRPYLRPVFDTLEIKAFGSKPGTVTALFESKARRTQRAEFRQAALNSITLALALIETQIAVQHKLDILLKAACAIHQVCTNRSWHVTSVLTIFNATPSLRMAVSDPFQKAAPILSGSLSVPDRLPQWNDAGAVDTREHPPVALHTLLHTLNQHPDLAQFYYQC